MQAPGKGSRIKGWKADDPRTARIEQKRTAILEAARSIFLREGWAGSSLERVAAEGGLSKMTVYRHFGTKEELFEALVGDMCREMRDQAASSGPSADAGPTEALDRLARDVVRGLMQPEALALYRLIIADGWRFPALARTFEQSGLAVLRHNVRAILAEAGVSEKDVGARASGFVNLLLGDAYLEAALGLDDPRRDEHFEQQITVAIGFALAASTNGSGEGRIC